MTTKTTAIRPEKSALDLFKVAGIQMASSPQVSSNLIEAERLIMLAVKQGAKLIVLPEYFLKGLLILLPVKFYSTS